MAYALQRRRPSLSTTKLCLKIEFDAVYLSFLAGHGQSSLHKLCNGPLPPAEHPPQCAAASKTLQ